MNDCWPLNCRPGYKCLVHDRRQFESEMKSEPAEALLQPAEDEDDVLKPGITRQCVPRG